MQLSLPRSLCLSTLLVLAACSREESSASSTPLANEPAASAPKSLDIWWFQWAPADGLQELGRAYEKESGVKVNVTQIPISSYQDKVFLEFGNTQTAFDVVIGDSQWIGRGATEGLYLELTDWLPTVVDLATIHPRAAKYLCEYPEGSGQWFAAPCETDACGVAYRKDWFEDAGERAAFQTRFGRELAVPTTWDEFEEVASFFQRPDEKRYGCALQTGRAYDALTMGLQSLLWAHGGMWRDESSFRVKGFLDTPGTASAVEQFKRLIALGPKKSENLDYGEVLEAFRNGSTAMMVNYFAFFPGVEKEMGAKVGFATVPGKDGRRIASLGGQGLSISTKTSKEQQALAQGFIAWFLKRSTQEQWITKPAGFTANTEILASAAFRAQTPYNAPFAESIETMRDFWNVPVFNELLAQTQKYIGKAIDGELATMEALEKLAIEKERILREAGLLP